MPVLQFVVGNPGAPIPGTDTYQTDLLRNAIVNFAIIDNVPENGLQPTPDYIHDPIHGILTRCNGNKFLLGMKGIIDYSTCNC